MQTQPPKNWQEVKLDDISTFQYGYTTQAKKKEVGPHLLRITDIAKDSINWRSVPFCKISDLNYKKFKLNNKDIVVARTGATAGFAKLIKNPPDSVFASYLIKIKLADNCDQQYVGKLIESIEFKRFINKTIGGSAQPQANVPVIKNFEFFLPPLIIQRKIAEILSSFEDLIENNRRRIEIIEEMAQLLYREWFVEFRFPGYEKTKMIDSALGKIPEGWKVDQVGNIFTIVLGGTPSTTKSEYWENGTIPWINSGEINKLRVISESEFITEIGLKNSSTKIMPKRTTLIAITGATLGQVSLLEIKACANQSVVGIYDEAGNFSEYIYLAIKNQIKEIIKMAGGGAQQHINKENVESVKMIIPENNVVNNFNNKIKPIFNHIFNLLKTNNFLKEIRDLQLPKLMSGEIEV